MLPPSAGRDVSPSWPVLPLPDEIKRRIRASRNRRIRGRNYAEITSGRMGCASCRIVLQNALRAAIWRKAWQWAEPSDEKEGIPSIDAVAGDRHRDHRSR